MQMKKPKPSCFVYVNAAKYCGSDIAKIGISNNPPKRLVEFNIGLTHRSRKGLIAEPVRFRPFYYVAANSQHQARHIEKSFLQKHKRQIIKAFGKEVVAMDAALAAEIVACIAGGECAA